MPALRMLRDMTLEKYCNTRSLDWGEARSILSKILKSADLTKDKHINQRLTLSSEEHTCRLFRVPRKLAYDDSICAAAFISASVSRKNVFAMYGYSEVSDKGLNTVSWTLTQSRSNTPRRNSGPIKLTNSNVAAVAFPGFHSGSRGIIAAMALLLTKASTPATTLRHPASAPAMPSNRARD